MFKRNLAPVGHPVVMEEAVADKFFGDNHIAYVDSGTSALALAIIDLLQEYSGDEEPYVVVPGYCCPDLISACKYAGVIPLAVDCRADAPHYELSLLNECLNDRVVAVIAVNFLGHSIDLSIYKDLISRKKLNTKIIEDNAQWFPVEKVFSSIADYSIFSFGKGKPVTMLGGGMVVSKSPLLPYTESLIQDVMVQGLALRAKVNAYNIILNPFLYGLISRNPFLKIGTTRFHLHHSIGRMDSFRMKWIVKNRNNYQYRWRAGGVLRSLTEYYAENLGFNRFLNDGNENCQREWLRYPLLCKTQPQRNQILDELVKKGLGATGLYPGKITAIEGVDGQVISPLPLNNAESFSKRILTLPVHEGVSMRYRKEIVSIIKSFY